MRSILVYCVGILSVACFLLSGCKLSPSADATSITVDFDTLQVDTICPLLASYSKPACHLQVAIASPKGSTAESARNAISLFVSNLVAQASKDAEQSQDMAAMVNGLSKSYIHRYLSEGRDAISNYSGDVEAAANWMSYEENVQGKVTYQADDVLCYEVRNESYTGGAHGGTSVRCGVMDMKALVPILFADVFSEESRQPLGQLMVNRLSQDCGGITIDEMVDKGLLLSEATIEPTDNFAVTTAGIEWVFDPYEIAPYSLGVIRVLVSWDDLQFYIDAQSPLLPLALKYRSNGESAL